MTKEVNIPDEFSDLVESCEQTRFGEQDRAYAPHVWRFVLTMMKSPEEMSCDDGNRVMDFCQKHCKPCRHSAEEYGKIQADDSLSFGERMSAVAEGRYTICPMLAEIGAPWRVEYKVVEDYID